MIPQRPSLASAPDLVTQYSKTLIDKPLICYANLRKQQLFHPRIYNGFSSFLNGGMSYSKERVPSSHLHDSTVNRAETKNEDPDQRALIGAL